jgi:outer membrane cobalamin receptor
MKTVNWSPLAAALLASGALPALGQNNAQSGADSPEELYVVGQRLEETTPQALAEFGNRLEVVDAEALRLGGFDDASQALQMQVPGLYVAPKNGAFDYINCSLQGSRCEDILWLVDGVRTANRLYNTTTPLDTIPASMVERVEVLYGGQGIFYGTQSIAGVVNVVTKAFSGEPTGSLSVGLDENDGTHLSGDFRTGAGDHQIVLFASQDESDGFHQVAQSDYQPSATDRDRGYDVMTLGAKYAYDFSDASRLSLMYQRTDNDVDFLRPYSTAVGKNERVDDWITAKWDYAASDTVDLYIKGYWHDWDTKFTEIFNDLNPNGSLAGTQSVDSDHLFWGFKDYGVTAVAEIRNPGSFEYVAGYDYQRFWGEDQVWLIEDKTETVHAIYGQIRTTEEQLENTSLALGLRYNSTSGTFDGTVWNFSGKHDFSPSFYVRGQVGTSFRLPDAEELYLRDCCEVGNPNLEPEESENLEVAIGGQSTSGTGLSWQFIVFQRDIDSLIGIDFDNPAFPDGIFANLDGTRETSGWEVYLNVGLGETMSLSFDYTDTDAELSTTGFAVQDVPETLIKLSWSYRGTQLPLDVNLSLVNVGDIFDTVGGGIGNVQHGDYTTVDASAGYYLDQARRHRIGARLENALDEGYVTGVGRGFRDIDGSSYAYRNLGTPRTLHATYTYRF